MSSLKRLKYLCRCGLYEIAHVPISLYGTGIKSITLNGCSLSFQAGDCGDKSSASVTGDIAMFVSDIVNVNDVVKVKIFPVFRLAEFLFAQIAYFGERELTIYKHL